MKSSNRTGCYFLVLLAVCLRPGHAGWVQTVGPVVQSTTGIYSDDSLVYLGMSDGGLFRSADSGQTWTRAAETSSFSQIAGFAMADSVLFAIANDGVYFSHDHGNTWEKDTTSPRKIGLTSLAASNDTVVVGTTGKVYISTDCGTTWHAGTGTIANSWCECLAISNGMLFTGVRGEGLYRSKDLGVTWDSMATGNDATWYTGITVCENGIFAITEDGVLHSPDGGDSWDLITLGRIGSGTITSRGACIMVTGMSGMYLSEDAGATWEDLTGSFSVSLYGGTIIGNTLLAITSGEGIFRSTNNGASWKIANAGLAAGNVTALSESIDAVIAAVFGRGLFRTFDNGLAWELRSSSRSIYQPVAMTRLGRMLFTATLDSGVYRSTDEGTTWEACRNGLTSLTVHSLAAGDVRLFAGTRNGVYRSIDSGATWERSWSGVPDLAITSLAESNGTVFAGTAETVYRSQNNGANWQEASGGLGIDSILTLLISDSSVFAGMAGGVYRSNDNGTLWVAADSGLTNKNVRSLACNGSMVYAATDDGVFISGDNGTSWIDGSEGLTNRNIRSLYIVDSILWAGTNGSGAWYRPIAELTGIRKRDARRPAVSVSPGLSVVARNDHITLALSVRSTGRVTVSLHAINGRVSNVLFDGVLASGTHAFDAVTTRMSPGVYLLAVKSDGYVCEKKVSIFR